MKIDESEIRSLARLAKLEFSDEELVEFIPAFEEIIEFADRVNEKIDGDTEDIRRVSSHTVAYDDLRDDEVRESLPSEKITSNVRDENGYFAVRRVVK